MGRIIFICNFIFMHEFDLLLSFQVQQNCVHCGVCMGKYFCSKCKFFDDDVSLCLFKFHETLSLVAMILFTSPTSSFFHSRFQSKYTIATSVGYAGYNFVHGFLFLRLLASLQFT